MNDKLRFWKFLLCFCCISQIWFANSAFGESNERYNLLIINSYNESAPWSNSVIVPVMREAGLVPKVEAYVVHMNTTFITNDSLYKKMEKELFRRYSGNMKPDFLVLIGNMAFNLRDQIKAKWGDIPMLLCAEMDFYAPRPYYYTGLGEEEIPEEKVFPLNRIRDKYNFTYVAAPGYYKETIDMMVRMLPEMKTLVFAADKLYLNRHHERNIKAYLAEKYPNIRYVRLVAGSPIGNRLRNYLIKDDPTIGLLFSTWFYEQNDLMGNPVLLAGDYRMIMSSGRPVFTLREPYVNEGGFVGGYYYDSNEIAQRLAEIVHEIVNGKQARDIPFYHPKHSYPLINYTILKNSTLSKRLVPSETVYINKPQTLWERYKYRILAGGGMLAVLFLILYVRHRYLKKELHILKNYNTLIKNMPVLYAQEKVILDENGNVVDLEYRTGNTMFKHLFAAEMSAGIKNLRGMFSSQSENFMHFVRIVLKEKRSVSFTYYFERTNSFYEIIIRESSEENVVDIFGLDTTMLHSTQNLLRTTNKKLAVALDVARIIPWRWDLSNHVIACDSHHSLFELDSEEYNKKGAQLIKESDYFDNVHPDDKERLKKEYQDLITGKTHFVKEEYRTCIHVGGRERINWIETHAVVEQRNEKGEPVALIGSLLVINDRKRNEQDLIMAKNRAEESDRLKSAFLANMSHEIRTPLNAIVGFSSILASTEEENEKKEYISIIENNNQLLLQLISDILDLAKIEAGTLDFIYSDIDLNGLMGDIENSVCMRMNSEARLTFVPGKKNCCIHMDRNRLSQVLINLLNNAVKFTPAGEITFGYEIRGEELYFYVKDTGCGIPKEKLEHIFERFVKLDSFVQGTGLGLSICQSIIDTMKGKMGVESEVGKGSKFWFTVPYEPAEMETAKEESVVLSKIDKEKITILIAEDDESNYRLFKSILQKDYQLIHAWDGVEAVKLFQEFRPHIILMDINMPNMNGYEATREIRKLSESVPIIAVTAYAYTSDKQKVMESGFNGYMSKPLHAGKLRDEIIATLNKNFIVM